MRLWCLLTFICVFYANFCFSCSIKDDVGAQVFLNSPAKRIISLAPDITETLFAIGAQNRIVGVVESCDYPPAALTIPRIGSYSGLDLERIISLHPDLIVTWGNMFRHQLSILKKLGIPVYISDPHHLHDIAHTIKNLGCLTGLNKNADHLSTQFLTKLSELERRYVKQKPLRVFYQIGPYALFTINQDSWINQVISLCGGRNVFAAAKVSAPEVSFESVVVANPEVIITSTTQSAWKKRWQTWQNIAAVKNRRLYAINPDLIERAGPRLLTGALEICRDLAKETMPKKGCWQDKFCTLATKNSLLTRFYRLQ